MKEDIDTEEFIDIHFHTGPEIIPRKFNAEEFVEEESGKLRGAVLKNHMYSTQAMINSLEAKEIELFGAVALNRFTGGMNPNTVRASAEISEKPLTVWFPTLDAENFLEEKDYEIPPEWTEGAYSRRADDVEPVKVSKNGELTNETVEVIEAIAETGSILATGHISWQEAEKVVEKALELGVEKVILTHPIYGPINMPVEVQKELAENEEVFVEELYAMNRIDGIPVEEIAEQIREVGPENVVLGSDMGQVGNPSSSEALKIFAEALIDEGFTESEIREMTVENPAEVLDLEALR
ncbi:MAG: DUF6282 family protein [Candidatus Nanosalina sp.]